MKRSVARALTMLYAPSWRRVYGQEFEALLIDVPLTPAVIADLVPRAAASRGRLFGALAAAAVMLSLAGSHVASPKGTGAFAVHAQSREGTSFLACRAYSSASAGGYIELRKCLD